MSEIMTVISVPGTNVAFQDYGRRSVEDIVFSFRAHADHMRQQVALIDNTRDEGFQVDLVRGILKQKLVKRLQNPKNLQKDKNQ